MPATVFRFWKTLGGDGLIRKRSKPQMFTAVAAQSPSCRLNQQNKAATKPTKTSGTPEAKSAGVKKNASGKGKPPPKATSRPGRGVRAPPPLTTKRPEVVEEKATTTQNPRKGSKKKAPAAVVKKTAAGPTPTTAASKAKAGGKSSAQKKQTPAAKAAAGAAGKKASNLVPKGAATKTAASTKLPAKKASAKSKKAAVPIVEPAPKPAKKKSDRLLQAIRRSKAASQKKIGLWDIVWVKYGPPSSCYWPGQVVEIVTDDVDTMVCRQQALERLPRLKEAELVSLFPLFFSFFTQRLYSRESCVCVLGGGGLRNHTSLAKYLTSTPPDSCDIALLGFVPVLIGC